MFIEIIARTPIVPAQLVLMGSLQLSLQAEAYAIWSEYYNKMSEESNAYPIDQISDPVIKMQLQKLQDKGSGALSPDKASEVRMTLLFHVQCFTSPVVI